MYNPIENLGDYNKVRLDLQKCGGDREKLYGKIGDIAVAKKSPKLLLAGAGIVIGAETLYKLGKCGIEYYKKRKKLIESESQIKQEFMEVMDRVDVDKEEGASVDEGVTV